MAIVIDNLITKGFSGKLGNLVFRTFEGRTIVSIAPRKPQTESPAQKAGRDRFAEAASFAKACMLDPQKKEYYWIKARKLKLPNAYTAALTEYLRKPKIEAVHQKGERVIVYAQKKGFPVGSVELIVSDATGSMSSTLPATLIRGQWDAWEVRQPDLDTGQKITIVAKDRAGNIDLFNMT